MKDADAWASPRQTEAQLVIDPSRRCAEAERLGLPWPQCRAKRGLGRGPPTFKMKFVEAVYVALRAQGWRASTRFDPLLGQRTLPPRRRRGKDRGHF